MRETSRKPKTPLITTNLIDSGSQQKFLKNFKNILEHAPAGICIVRGPEHVFEVANQRYLEMIGKREIIGKTVREALPEVENQGFFEILDKVYTTGEPYQGKEVPVELRRNNQIQLLYVDFVYQPTLDEQGKVDGIFVHAIDVTEKVKARKKIEESEHKYYELIHSTHSSLIATFKGEEMIIEIANDAILEVWGKGKDVIGNPLLKVLPELKDQGLDKVLADVYRTGKPYKAYEMPVRLIRNGKDELIYFNFVYYPQRDVEGNIIGIVDIATEVTPQALVNKKIKESELHFRQIADLMPAKVSNSDAEGNIIYLNKNWLSYTGLSSEEFKTKGWTAILHPEELEEFQRRRNLSLKTGNSFEMELRFLDKDGKYKWHLCRAQAVKDESGKILKWITTNTEIQKIKEEEKRKEDFLKMVSHELKTPVTSIKGYVQLLLKLINDSKIETAGRVPIIPSLERIDHQITRLTRLISEMLDLTRIEDNKLELKLQKFSLNKLIDETIQDIQYTNTQHQINVRHDFECEVIADRDRIGQVMINLITNSIKYSPESQIIEVGVAKEAKDKVAVSIKDYGIGIAKKDHKNIFKRFFRIGKKSDETYAGFGIGLFLANDIIARHNGSIEVNSEEGKGAEFTFTLAVAPE